MGGDDGLRPSLESGMRLLGHQETDLRVFQIEDGYGTHRSSLYQGRLIQHPQGEPCRDNGCDWQRHQGFRLIDSAVQRPDAAGHDWFQLEPWPPNMWNLHVPDSFMDFIDAIH